MKERKYDFEAIRKLQGDQLKQAVKELSALANKRLSRLEKAGLTQYAYKRLGKLQGKEKPHFSKRISDKNLTATLNQLEDFLNRPTSTITGAKKAHARAVSELKKDRVTDEGIFMRGLELNYENQNDFFDFLTSEEYKIMSQLIASEDLQEFFLDVHDELPLDTLKKLFIDFQNFKFGWNEFYDKIAEVQELQYMHDHGEKMDKEQKKEYRRLFR